MELERGLKPRGEKNLFPQKKKKKPTSTNICFFKKLSNEQILGYFPSNKNPL